MLALGGGEKERLEVISVAVFQKFNKTLYYVRNIVEKVAVVEGMFIKVA